MLQSGDFDLYKEDTTLVEVAIERVVMCNHEYLEVIALAVYIIGHELNSDPEPQPRHGGRRLAYLRY